jgi:hypothetical protein
MRWRSAPIRVWTWRDWIETPIARFGLRIPYQGGNRCLGSGLSPKARLFTEARFAFALTAICA